MLSVHDDARQSRTQNPRNELSKLSITQYRRLTKLFHRHLIEDFTSRRQRFEAHRHNVADRIGNGVKVLQRQRQILGEGPVLRHDSQHFAPCTVPVQTSLAELADRSKSTRPARNIDIARYALRHPSFFLCARDDGDVFYLADEFVARHTAEIVITTQNFNIRIADACAPQPHQGPASAKLWQRLLYFNKISVFDLERDHRSAAASASANAASCSANTVRRSRTTRSFSIRAITAIPACPRRSRCSNCAAECLRLWMRINFVGNDCAGVDPPPTSDSPSTTSSSTSFRGTSGLIWPKKLRVRLSNSSAFRRIIASAGIASSVPC